jgi:hypothetical protein
VDQAGLVVRKVPACHCDPDPMYLPSGTLACGSCKRPYIPPGASPFNGIVPPPEHRWVKGQSGNPLGRPAAGASIKEWLNVMADWTEEQLDKVIGSKAEPLAKRAAAQQWKQAISDSNNKVGMPVAGEAFDRINDRTEGSPVTRNVGEKNVRVLLVHTAPPPPPDGEFNAERPEDHSQSSEGGA